MQGQDAGMAVREVRDVGSSCPRGKHADEGEEEKEAVQGGRSSTENVGGWGEGDPIGVPPIGQGDNDVGMLLRDGGTSGRGGAG